MIFGWLEQRTGSIWAPSLAHAATNAVGGSLTMLWFYDGGQPVLTAYVGVLAWPPLALVCWLLWRSDRTTTSVRGAVRRSTG